MSEDIELGDKVKDIITGYTGIAVAKTEFINGCVQFSVAKVLKSGEKPDPQGEPSIDSQSLRVIKKRAVVLNEDEDEDEDDDDDDDDDDYSSGGPTTYRRGMRGY